MITRRKKNYKGFAIFTLILVGLVCFVGGTTGQDEQPGLNPTPVVNPGTSNELVPLQSFLDQTPYSSQVKTATSRTGIVVPSDGSTVSTDFVLTEGEKYTIHAYSTYVWGYCDPSHCPNIGPDGLRFGDAEYISDDRWATTYEVYVENIGLLVNGVDVDFGPFNPDHDYYYTLTGNGQPATFRILDCSVCYVDNSGHLLVDICHGESCPGQTFSISGTIKDSSGEPVSGVEVCTQNDDCRTTNYLGYYAITGIPAGTYEITPSTLSGYSFSPPDRKDIRVGPNATGMSFLASDGAPPDLIPYKIEVTQGIQDLNNSVPLVAGKRTFVRFYAKSDFGVHLTDAQLVVRRDNEEVTLTPKRGNIFVKPDDETYKIYRGLLDSGFLFEIPSNFTSGLISLTATVNPGTVRSPIETDYDNNTTPEELLSFEEVPPIHLVVYSIGYVKDGEPYYPESWEPKQMVDWVRSAFPVSEIDVSYRKEMFTDRFGRPIHGHFLADRGGLALPFLVDIRNGHKTEGNLKTPDTRYVGLVDDAGLIDDEGYQIRGATIPEMDSQGNSLGGLVSIVRTGEPIVPRSEWDHDGSYGDEYGGHELGHAYGLGHVICPVDQLINENEPDPPFDIGNPEGKISFWSGGDDAVYGLRVWHDRQSGNLAEDIFQVIYPNWYDIMSYCKKPWMSDKSYERLLAYLQDQPFVAQERFLDGSGTTEIAQLQDVYLISGVIDSGSNAAELSPLYVIADGIYPGDPMPGAYDIVLFDDTDIELARYPFKPSDIISGVGNNGSESLIFSELIPQSGGTARVSIEHLGTEIGSITAGSYLPTVQITSPNGGETITTDTVSVSWSADDLDGEPLSFRIGYSPDNGGKWITVAHNTNGSPIEIDTLNLPASDQALFRVSATDGIHTTTDESDSVFTVANHLPEVTILNPASGAKFASNQTINLEAFVYDSDSGTIDPQQIEWLSDLDGSLGNGAQLALSGISSGEHLITVRATDDQGAVVEESVAIQVVGSTGGLPASPDALVVGPDNIQFYADTGVISDTVAIENANVFNPVTWQISSRPSWIQLDSLSGTTPDVLTIIVDTASLDSGVYSGDVRISSPDLAGGTQVISVNLVVSDTNEPNDTTGEATPITYDSTINGAVISPVGDVDYFTFEGDAGDEIIIDIDANVIGSPLEPDLRLLDATGSILANWTGMGDPYLVSTLPTDGHYYLEVTDVGHPDNGGPDYVYQLVLAQREQVVELEQGWSMISSNLIPKTQDMEVLFPLPLQEKLVLCKDGDGKVYWPEMDVNEIGGWDHASGYQCYATEGFSISIIGASIYASTTPMPLDPTWNMIAYWPKVDIPVDQALGSLGGALVLVKTSNGETYWPDYGINTIGMMKPGQGYQMYLNAPATLQYPVD